MWLGANKTIITPDLPCDLAGFAHRTGKANEKYGELYLRTTLLQTENTIVCFFVADMIWWDDDLVNFLRKKLSKETNMSEHHFHFLATHNHSGPQVSKRFSIQLGLYNENFKKKLIQKVCISFRQAKDSLEKVKIQVRKSSIDIGIYRRKWVDGKIEMAPNEAVPVDQDLMVISFINKNHQEIATWIHYACHPTSTDANILSGEYPGVCTAELEALDKDCVVSFFQGFSGDIRPKLVKNDKFYRGSLAEMIDIGKKLCQKVLLLKQHPSPNEEHIQLHVREVKVPLKYDDRPFPCDVPNSLKYEWTMKKDRHKNDHLVFSYITISERISLLLANAEMVQSYGHALKRLNPCILPTGYANGMIGYVANQKQLNNGGYEAKTSLYYFSVKGKLHPHMEEIILQKFYQLIKGVSTMTKLVEAGKVGFLNYKVYETREDMGFHAGKKAADAIKNAQEKKDEVRVIFACAPSQNEMLQHLLNDDAIDWSKVVGFHMDEYVGLPQDSDQTFQQYIKDHLLSKKKLKAFHFIDSSLDPNKMIEKYTELISEKPIDLVCLGVGENGHIAFNDPPVADFQDPHIIKKVALDEFSRKQQVNDGCFATIDEVPTHALTLTIPALLKGETLVCTVPGKTKTKTIHALLNDDISIACPATILRTHENAHLFLDREAFGKIQ